MNIGDKIRQFRTAKGLTQKELGKLSETAETTVRQYEGGKRTPRIDQIEKIAAALDVTPPELMGWGYWDAKHPEFYQALSDEEAFESYLSKLGYTLNFEGIPGNPHSEAQTDDSGDVVGYAKVDEEETFEVTVAKGKLNALFTKSEFDELQGKYFELQKKIAELEADYQDIIEMRIQKKSEPKKKSRPSRKE